MAKLPFYFSRELTLAARAALADLFDALNLFQQLSSEITYELDEEGNIVCGTIDSLDAALAESLNSYCEELGNYGVLLDTRTNALTNEPLAFWDARLITEIYMGVDQTATRLYDLVHKYLECEENDAACQELLNLSKQEIFRQLFTEAGIDPNDEQAEEYLSFYLEARAANDTIATYGCPDAAMCVNPSDPSRIVVFWNGYGFSNTDPDPSTPELRPIPRYNISHETIHILSILLNLRTGNDPHQGAGKELIASIAQLLKDVKEPKEIAYPFYPEAYGMEPQGFNNWYTTDEIGTEALTILIWQNAKLADFIKEDYAKADKAAPDSLGYKPDQNTECMERLLLHALFPDQFGEDFVNSGNCD